ncbi:hypothetical protein EIP91_000088 [Steccherinum ochraceum]|uniref:NTF2 domain-containing protein n=1 Tax=Steccherinum ochraceum TaxID=92696 RepID=A0A4R0RV19_9APHY|nr:hypothetical protein EIP91_000088 [Steccherinum ochraceum]
MVIGYLHTASASSRSSWQAISMTRVAVWKTQTLVLSSDETFCLRSSNCDRDWDGVCKSPPKSASVRAKEFVLLIVPDDDLAFAAIPLARTRTPFLFGSTALFTHTHLIMTNTASTTSSAVNPSEVGWQFVPQYYTFVNKQPNRLHCFYTKASTFIHGTEGEDGKPCFGQQEIHAKITSIGFQDCKVFIHSVDAQSSANGGIIIQVIGEMSNNGDPWRKFVQTFFLAEQPNGYFVLNDIFRFLKEEAVDDEQASETEASGASAAPEPAAPAPAPVPIDDEPAPEPEPQEETVAPSFGEIPPATEEHPAPPEPEPEPEPQTNVSPAAPAQPLAPSPAPPAPQPQAAPAPAPVAAAPPPPAAPAAPTPAAPPQPKTWANLAATNSNKWGSAVAQEVRGVSEAPVATSSPAPSSGQQTPAPRARPPPPQVQGDAMQAALSVTTAQCFVKSVTENVPESLLKQTLTQRFGPIKELDIHRPKACAFLEFTTVEAARKAIAVSLPQSQGGEGGIRIGNGVDGGLPPRILVETRKERGERPPPRGPPVNGGPDNRRGNFRGRGGPGGGRGRGVGVPPQK